MHISTTQTTNTTLASTKMHSLKSFFFTLLLLLSLSTQKFLVDANTKNLDSFNIEQVTLNNNDSFAYESDNEDIINRTPLTIESEIIAEEFRYLMKFGVKTYGDDHDDTYAIPDTGSDLIWLQERTCKDGKGNNDYCYCDLKGIECREKPKSPIHCEDEYCDTKLQDLHIKHACTKKYKCKFTLEYGDRSKTEGILGKANFLFGAIGNSETDRFTKITKIGFNLSKLEGDKNIEDEPKSLYQGVVGLGHGDISLISQYSRITPKFSYYLPQFRRKDEKYVKDLSKFTFGDDVKIISDKSTPLLTTKDVKEFHECDIRYCVHLNSISLKLEGDEQNYEVKSETHKVMIIDSGSTFTHLSGDIFEDFLKKIEEKLNVKPLPKKDVGGDDYDNCFEKNNENVEKLKKLEKISFEFSGTKIDLKKENFLDDDYTPPTKDSNGEQKKYICLTVQKENANYYKRLRNYGKLSSNVQYHILGSRAQMDFTVAFDLGEGNKKVSFNHEEDKHIEESLVLSE